MHQRNCSTSLANLTKTLPPAFLRLSPDSSSSSFSLFFFPSFIFTRRFSTFLTTRLSPLGFFDNYPGLALSFIFFLFFSLDLWRLAFRFSRNSSSSSSFFGNWKSPRRFVFSDFCFFPSSKMGFPWISPDECIRHSEIRIKSIFNDN